MRMIVAPFPLPGNSGLRKVPSKLMLVLDDGSASTFFIQDLVQDVFVEAARGLRRLRQPEAIKSWLAAIAVRTVRRRLRLRRVKRFIGLDREANPTTLIDPGGRRAATVRSMGGME